MRENHGAVLKHAGEGFLTDLHGIHAGIESRTERFELRSIGRGEARVREVNRPLQCAVPGASLGQARTHERYADAVRSQVVAQTFG